MPPALTAHKHLGTTTLFGAAAGAAMPLIYEWPCAIITIQPILTLAVATRASVARGKTGKVTLVRPQAVGEALAGMGLKGFLMSSNFIDGGVTGVSMLLAKVTPVPLAVLLPVVNLPFIAIGYRQLGWAFALRSAL